MDRRLYDTFAAIAYNAAGIRIREGSEALVAARVAKRVRALHLPSEVAYLAHLESDQTGRELAQFVDAITTNLTSFFREADHFEVLAEVVRERREAGQRRFRLWSAACSTGEEPWSMAIAALEAMGDRASGTDVRILATDISCQVLKVASAGRYDEERMERVPARLRDRWFEPAGSVSRAGHREWRVRDAIRRLVVFKRLNLSQMPLHLNGPLDMIFCRNVMIYFDGATRARLVEELARLLRPNGLLAVGHTETLARMPDGLGRVRPSVFRKAPFHGAEIAAPPRLRAA